MPASVDLATLRSAGRRVRQRAEHRPEWSALVVAALGWVVLLRMSLASPGSVVGRSTGPSTLGDLSGGLAGMCGIVRGTGWSTWSRPAQAAGMWVVMTLAMMLPLTVPSMRHVARMVPAAARPAALAIFCSAFVLAWMPGASLAVWVHGRPPVTAGIVAGAFVAAGAWELTPVKRQALLACHRTAVIRAAGPGRRRTCWRYGLSRGAWCTASCGPLMLALLLSGHAIVALLAVSVGLTLQRYSLDAYRLRGWSAAAFSLIALVVVVAP